MSSPSRKVGLRKRFSIAVKATAAGATAAVLTPVFFYRSWVKQAENNRPKTTLDWGRLSQTIQSSGVLQMLISDLVDMMPGRDDNLWVDEDEDENSQEDTTVH